MQSPNSARGVLDEPSGILHIALEKRPEETSGKEITLQEPTTRLPAYSVFSTRRKKCTVWLIALASWFSPASSFIYFPAIVPIAESLGVSVSKINATVTSYLVVSAVAPTVLGRLADELGRRPVIVGMLIVYILANVGLAVQRSYVALLLLRMLQSAGMSGSIAVSYGVVADIATSSERGGYVGIISFGANTAPAISPMIGALILYYKGWAAIFWFLAIFSGVCLGLIFFILPETARNIVGDGSVKPAWTSRTPYLRGIYGDHFCLPEKKRTGSVANPLSCLVLLWDYSNAIVISSQSVCYMTLTCLQTSLSSLFVQIYVLNNLQLGLIYLPFGAGCAISAFTTGRILDRLYRDTALKYGFTIDKRRGDDPEFPIAKARLRALPYSILPTCALVIAYGWSLHAKAHISVPLIIQFCLGLFIQSSLTTFNTLLTDLNVTAPSTAQASCNLVRCTLAAVCTAVIQPVINRVGVGWCFTILGLGVWMTIPGLCLLWGRSIKWQVARTVRGA